jgi:Putative DNA-binding domain
MIEKPLAAIVAADIERLVAEGTTEGRTIEFKRDLPGMKDSERKEFLADVSSFANAAGGDLIYGVEEKNGTAVRAAGLVIANIDAEVLRLDQMIRTGISPRLVGCQVQSVPGLPNGPAIVVRVPRSWQGPHIVSFQQDFRFYSRSTNGKFRMDASDVRDAVLNAGTIEDRIRVFRFDRLARIVAAETPVPLAGTKLICIHVIPFEALGGSHSIDLRLASEQASLLRPFYSDGYSDARFNIDGLYTFASADGGHTSGGYVQCFRNGILEAVDVWMIPSLSDKHPDAIPSLAFPQHLFAFVERALRLLAVLDVVPPIAMLVSVLGSKGIVLGVNNTMSAFRSPLRPLDRDVLLLPDVVVQEIGSFESAVTFKPLLDALWQAFGMPRCMDYDEQGKWTPRR